MTQKDYKIARELKEKLLEVVPLVDFRIFGSRARGNQSKYSDIDVFIEVEEIDRKMEEKIQEIAWEVGFEHSIYISPLIFTLYEIEKSPLKVSPIVKNINEEGIKI